MNTARYSNQRPHAQQTKDWHMSIMCYSQDVGEVISQLTNFHANLKKTRDMLDSGKTGVTAERPYGILGCERLKNTGKIVIRLVDKNGDQIGQNVEICAPLRNDKFMKDEKTGLIVPIAKQDAVPWRESLKLGIKVITNAIHYMELGKFIERARMSWDDEAKLTPLGDAIQHNLSFLNLEGSGEEPGILREYLVRLVWPIANGRAFNGLEDGFNREASVDGNGGCWIYKQTDAVMRRIAEVQTKALAELEAAEARKLANTAITESERQAMVAKAQAVGVAAVAAPEPAMMELEPTTAIVAEEAQDAQAS